MTAYYNENDPRAAEWLRELIKARLIAPGLSPLAHGLPGRVGLLRGYGNAIVPKLAAEFIRAYLET